jgi:3'-phosphoadenosine 5'-phosphosulfate sulfotransferase (PAPS reductase)/FAD synthetase
VQSLLPTNFSEVIDHYSPKIALQFSGGRDSLALLLLCKPFWNKLTVYYTNSGDAYPETLELVNRVREKVPNFIEIPGKVLQTRATDGFASDVLPARATWGFEAYRDKLGSVGREVCCFKSIMLPMHAAMRADGIKCIIRGQRSSDEPKSPIQSGEIVDGFALYLPIDAWTDAEVEYYIKEQGEEVPPYYAAGMTSAPDCMTCTAWLETGIYAYNRVKHPQAAKVQRIRLEQILKKVVAPVERMKYIAGDKNG